jgi:hypothetical protein
MKTVSQSIADYVAAQTANDNAEDAAIIKIQANVAAQQAALNAINNSPGQLSAADQTSLDTALTHGNSISTALTALAAIQAPTPPVVPPAADSVFVP